jgi:hypothetical protein
MKNTKIFQSGLVVMGNLPRWKMQRFLKGVKNTRIFQSGEKCEDFSKMVKNAKIFQSGLVVMGDLPR